MTNALKLTSCIVNPGKPSGLPIEGHGSINVVKRSSNIIILTSLMAERDEN